jgi:D(-)-tartrate dehydratase
MIRGSRIRQIRPNGANRLQPTGGFADGAVVERSYVGLTETPGIGFEQKAAFHKVLRALHA